MNKNKWQSIGTVLGETNIDHFYFSLKNYKAKKGDIITTESKIPSSEGNIVPVTVNKGPKFSTIKKLFKFKFSMKATDVNFTSLNKTEKKNNNIPE